MKNMFLLYIYYLQSFLCGNNLIIAKKDNSDLIDEYKIAFNVFKIFISLNHVTLSLIVMEYKSEKMHSIAELILRMKKFYHLFFQRLKVISNSYEIENKFFNDLYRDACENEKNLVESLLKLLKNSKFNSFSNSNKLLYIISTFGVNIILTLKNYEKSKNLVFYTQNFLFKGVYEKLITGENVTLNKNKCEEICIFSYFITEIRFTDNENIYSYLNIDFNRMSWLILSSFYVKNFQTIIIKKFYQINNDEICINSLYLEVINFLDKKNELEKLNEEIEKFYKMNPALYVDYLQKFYLEDEKLFLNCIYSYFLKNNEKYVETFIILHKKLVEKLFNIAKKIVLSKNSKKKIKKQKHIRIYYI